MQGFFDFISSNTILNTVFVAWATAQILKTLINYAVTKEFKMERLTGAGGMPSSHTALVISLVVATMKEYGFESPEFALAAAFAGIVMYDAVGVRRAAGEQAKIINRMIDDWLDKVKITGKNIPQIKELKELLGHTPIEVFGGVIVGVVVAVLM